LLWGEHREAASRIHLCITGPQPGSVCCWCSLISGRLNGMRFWCALCICHYTKVTDISSFTELRFVIVTFSTAGDMERRWMEYFYLAGRLTGGCRNVHDEDLHCLNASLNIFQCSYLWGRHRCDEYKHAECTVYRICVGNSAEWKQVGNIFIKMRIILKFILQKKCERESNISLWFRVGSNAGLL
jgi:hypothetical protein